MKVVIRCRECGKKVEIKPIALKGTTGKNFVPEYCWECADALYRAQNDETSMMLKSQYVRGSGIPNKFYNHFSKEEVVPTEDQKDTFYRINTLTLNSHPLPYLWGSPGVGKTFFGAYIIYKYINTFCSEAFFVSISNLISDRYGTIEDHEGVLFKRTTIVIDDLGNHLINEKVISYIFKALSFRMENNIPTCITSNSNPVELGKRIMNTGKSIDKVMIDALTDRIIELCSPIEITGKSIRVKNFFRRNSNE